MSIKYTISNMSNTYILINDKKVDPIIRISQRKIYPKPPPYKSNVYEKEGGRVRSVPKHNHKKYPVKPKNHAVIHRNKYLKYTL
jgi:hypothetical protein